MKVWCREISGPEDALSCIALHRCLASLSRPVDALVVTPGKTGPARHSTCWLRKQHNINNKFSLKKALHNNRGRLDM